jgi:hypothetical protein
MPELLQNWNAKVKEIVPVSKLLVMEVKQGWEPLCQFLNLPIPKEPFPRANDSAAAETTFNHIVNQLQWVWIGVMSVTVATAGVCLWVFMQR